MQQVQFCALPRVYIHKMSRFPQPPSPAAPLDEAAEARALADFFAGQDPADVAAADWHTRAEQGLGTAEQHALMQWLAADPAHAAAWRRLEQVGAEMAALRALPAARTARAREGAAGADAAPRDRAKPRRRWPAWNLALPRPALLAAACAAVLALGVGWQQWQQPTFSSAYAAGQAQRKTVTLPDGTQLAMDADTQAQVTLYRDRREVRLAQGQILFAVAPDRAKPFDVLAGPAHIRVVGTRFSVRYRSTGMDAGAVRIAVEEGHVRVSGVQENAGDAADLHAGQGLSVARDGAVGAVTAVAPSSIGLWRKGLVRFEDTPLGDALRELERYGPTRLVIRDPAVAAMTLGGSYPVDHPAEFARMVTQILPLRLVPGADGSSEIARAH